MSIRQDLCDLLLTGKHLRSDMQLGRERTWWPLKELWSTLLRFNSNQIHIQGFWSRFEPDPSFNFVLLSTRRLVCFWREAIISFRPSWSWQRWWSSNVAVRSHQGVAVLTGWWLSRAELPIHTDLPGVADSCCEDEPYIPDSLSLCKDRTCCNHYHHKKKTRFMICTTYCIL